MPIPGYETLLKKINPTGSFNDAFFVLYGFNKAIQYYPKKFIQDSKKDFNEFIKNYKTDTIEKKNNPNKAKRMIQHLNMILRLKTD